jgi:hypothetical protein
VGNGFLVEAFFEVLDKLTINKLKGNILWHELLEMLYHTIPISVITRTVMSLVGK